MFLGRNQIHSWKLSSTSHPYLIIISGRLEKFYRTAGPVEGWDGRCVKCGTSILSVSALLSHRLSDSSWMGGESGLRRREVQHQRNPGTELQNYNQKNQRNQRTCRCTTCTWKTCRYNTCRGRPRRCRACRYDHVDVGMLPYVKSIVIVIHAPQTYVPRAGHSHEYVTLAISKRHNLKTQEYFQVIAWKEAPTWAVHEIK